MFLHFFKYETMKVLVIWSKKTCFFTPVLSKNNHLKNGKNVFKPVFRILSQSRTHLNILPIAIAARLGSGLRSVSDFVGKFAVTIQHNRTRMIPIGRI